MAPRTRSQAAQVAQAIAPVAAAAVAHAVRARGRPKGSKDRYSRCAKGTKRYGPAGFGTCISRDRLSTHLSQVSSGGWNAHRGTRPRLGRKRCERGMKKYYDPTTDKFACYRF